MHVLPDGWALVEKIQHSPEFDSFAAPICQPSGGLNLRPLPSSELHFPLLVMRSLSDTPSEFTTSLTGCLRASEQDITARIWSFCGFSTVFGSSVRGTIGGVSNYWSVIRAAAWIRWSVIRFTDPYNYCPLTIDLLLLRERG